MLSGCDMVFEATQDRIPEANETQTQIPNNDSWLFTAPQGIVRCPERNVFGGYLLFRSPVKGAARVKPSQIYLSPRES